MNTLNMYILNPLHDMFLTVWSFVPAMLCVILILFFGYMVTRLLRDTLPHLFKMMRLDKVMDWLKVTKLMHVGKVKHSLSHLLTALISLVVTFMFVILSMHFIGINTLSEKLSDVITYVTPVVTAMFVLVVGMVVAKIVSLIIHMVVATFGLPNPKLLERISRWAILLFAAKLALIDLGFGFLFTGLVFHIWFAGLVLGLALAFGLGGRDMAARYLAKKDK